ncbi:MAG TPA: chromosomal replication initiator protein DnaA [Solirubrobacterales bacterium]|nr:chromosomal replication initiator protein DnaA [Solirubrobacterales bacterium]
MPDDSPGQNLDALWEEVRQRLRGAVPRSTFDIWLEPVRPVGSQGPTLYVSAPDGIRTWVERRYRSLLREALQATGSPLTEIAFGAAAKDGRDLPDRRRCAELNPNYTFERFVIGEGNRVAHAAALAVAETPSEAYNPLFLHGPPGLGKTHLLGAVANYLRANAPGLSVRYTTAEGFTNEFVGALRSSGAEEFKNRYRDLDVLLVDDVQFLQGKQHTEEEFFHTFNALYEGGSQLVLSADRLPSELSTLEARLRDRFEWGLTIPVEPPDLATRLTVLRRLAREAGVEAGDQDALSELARRIDANVRRLHGALTKVIAHASLTAKPLSPELIAELIPNRAQQTGPTTVEEIQQQVAAAFGISRAELVGSSRAATPLRARQIAILLTREATDLSLPQIGRLYGGRDHSTVLNSLRRVEATVVADSDLARQVGELRSSIHSARGGRGAPPRAL